MATVAATPKQELWAYEGSRVQPMNLETLRAIHRLSYGHRGRRSVLVVAYDPLDPACQQVEWEVERLATGLRHAPHVLVASLNMRTAHLTGGGQGKAGMTAQQFLTSITDARQLPLVLMYPEGAPGLMRLKTPSAALAAGLPAPALSAEVLCAALNSCLATVCPGRPPLQLDDDVVASVAPVLAVAAQQHQQQAGRQQLAQQAAAPSPTSGLQASAFANLSRYWTPGKLAFWGGIALLSVLSVLWERWLGPQLEMRAMAARQAARQAGQPLAEDDVDAALDDLFRLRSQQAAAAANNGSPALPAGGALGAGGQQGLTLGKMRSALLQGPPPPPEGVRPQR